VDSDTVGELCHRGSSGSSGAVELITGGAVELASGGTVSGIESRGSSGIKSWGSSGTVEQCKYHKQMAEWRKRSCNIHTVVR
jgi:hypothetical protein